MPRSLAATGLLLLSSLSQVAYPSGASAVPPRVNAPALVTNEALARVLGEALLRDTLEVISDLPAVAPGQPASARTPEPDASTQAARTLLAHRSLESYRWLIEHAFEESVWRRSEPSLLQRNFPAIWRAAVRRYEATLGASPARLRVCKPNARGDDFDCADESAPVSIVPIPALSDPLVAPDRAVIG